MITTCKRIIRNLREERERKKSTRCVRIVNLKVQSVVLDDINIDMLSILRTYEYCKSVRRYEKAHDGVRGRKDVLAGVCVEVRSHLINVGDIRHTREREQKKEHCRCELCITLQ